MMTLRHSTTSPFARKVWVVALETGLDRRIDLLPSFPWVPDSPVAADNPLGKIPVLITPECGALFDSPVICEYLDSLHDGPRLFPAAGPERWAALRQQAVADGICDAAVLCRLESLRPEDRRSDDWMGRQRAAIARALDVLAAALPAPGPVTIGHIALACALGYLDFRQPVADWRAGRPGLAAWYQAMLERPSLAATPPHD